MKTKNKKTKKRARRRHFCDVFSIEVPSINGFHLLCTQMSLPPWKSQTK